MQLQHELDYLVCISPLLAALTAIPTMEEAVSGHLLWPRLMTCQKLLSKYRQLVLTQPSLEHGEWWRLITHLFVHRDPDHLFNNVCGILCSGFSVFNHLGGFAVYAMFLLGGVSAGLNSWGRAFQTENQLQASIPSVPSAVPESAQRMWNTFRVSAAKWTAPMVSSRAEAYGSSGGVCGLMGLSLGLSLHRFYRLLLGESASSGSWSRQHGWRLSRPSRPFELLVTVVNVFQSGHFLIQ
ncbi:unnamed protein product, partial [Durusdinium trenchii]